VLGAVRSYAVEEYATPQWLAKMVNDPKMLPVFFGLTAVLFLVLGFLLKAVGVDWLNFWPTGEEIVHSKFFHTWLVDLIFVPTSLWVVAIFALSLQRFMKDIHENAVLEGKTDKKTIEGAGFIAALGRVIPTILKHQKFSECGENEGRATSHMMVFYSFVGLFIVTGCFFFSLYVLQVHGPYPQMCAVKWLANVSGIALVIGTCLMIKDRLAKTDEVSTYKDWYLLIMVLGVGLSGMLTEMTRMGGVAKLSYLIYFVHLVFVFNLFVFLPFSKLAHLVYRTVAMAYVEYAGRK
jgi:quinone-modifying oxidoreductase subunit QmoC